LQEYLICAIRYKRKSNFTTSQIYYFFIMKHSFNNIGRAAVIVGLTALTSCGKPESKPAITETQVQNTITINTGSELKNVREAMQQIPANPIDLNAAKAAAKIYNPQFKFDENGNSHRVQNIVIENHLGEIENQTNSDFDKTKACQLANPGNDKVESLAVSTSEKEYSTAEPYPGIDRDSQTTLNCAVLRYSAAK
jgi:hypothetical protein